MKKPCRYILVVFVLFTFSCKESTKTKGPVHSSDSWIKVFSWANVKEDDRDTTAIYLGKLAAQNRGVESQIKLYADLCYYQFTFKKDLLKGLSYADSLILLAEKSDPDLYSRELSLGYYSKGDILFALGNYDEAYQNYYAAKKIMDTKKDNCTSGDYCYRIGMVLYQQAKYTDACSFFKQAFQETLSCKQEFAQIYREQELLNNVALCFSKLSQIDSAIFYYEKALKFIDKNDTVPARKFAFNVAKGVVYGNMGGEYVRKSAYSKAEELLKKSIAINILPKHENNDAALTQIKLGRLYLSTDELSKAAKLMEELKVNMAKVHDDETSRKFHHLMGDYFNRIGQKDLAFEHLSKYVVMKDSAQIHLNKVRETDIYERFRNLDSQVEITYLKREKHIQKVYLYITFLFSTMAIAIILLIYFYWKKSKKNIQLLTKLNERIFYQKLQLEDMLANLEQSNNEKDSLLRAVAHDLRNPIGGISSLVELMLEEDTDEEIKHQHSLIKETCLNALALINELIEAAENQNVINVIGKKLPLNIAHLIANTLELLRFKAQEKQQQIKFDATNEPIIVEVNQEKILRVISNLISNAIKFSIENTEITVVATVKGSFVEIGVIDHGIGIPQGLADHIFQMFTSAKRLGTQGEKSYGLGLSISKQIIEAHGGQIWFERNPDGGTTFYFSLPLRKM